MCFLLFASESDGFGTLAGGPRGVMAESGAGDSTEQGEGAEHEKLMEYARLANSDKARVLVHATANSGREV